MRLTLAHALLPLVLVAARPADEPEWIVLPPSATRATNGVELEARSDHSILAGGKNPKQAVYEVDFELPPGKFTALRLEALIHDSLPLKGPGRGDNGNFVLSELVARVSQKGSVAQAREVVFKEGVADHHEPALTPSHSVDGKVTPDQGWSPEAWKEHVDRYAVFLPAKQFGFNNGARLSLRMTFESKWERHAIGRFRVSVADGDPLALLPEAASVDPAEVDAATRRGIDYLLDRQEADGSWVGADRLHYYGMTGLGVYTLVQCGVRPDHPAIRAGLAFMGTRPITRTYDCGVSLLAYRAVGDPLPRDRIEAVGNYLVDMMGNGSSAMGVQWGYPYGHTPTSPRNHVDLSNTQYALLGLRAAASCGVRVPPAIWERVAKELVESQGDYGSFAYIKGRAPTTAMTVAGITCLLVCADGLEKAKRSALAGRCRSAAERGETWLDRNWTVEANIQVPHDAGQNRWFYYYLHGLERVGSLSNKRIIGRHDWYTEGASSILAKQNTDGSWSTANGENDTNTCFALLFLQRGTASTQRGERPKTFDPAAEGGAFEIATNGDEPLVAWVRTLGAPVLDRLGKGDRIAAVEWTVDDEVVERVEPAEEQDVKLQRFPLKTTLAANGAYKLRADMRFVDEAGADLGVEKSVELTLRVDSVEEAYHREVIRDAPADLVDDASVAVEVSSQFDNNWPAAHAVDGRAGTSWLSRNDDAAPWIRLRFRRPVKAGVLKLVPAHPYLGTGNNWARPREIDIRVNGGKPVRARLLDDVLTKQGISFEEKKLRSIKISVVSVYPGVGQRLATGFAAVELYPADHPMEDTARGDAAYSSPILPKQPGDLVMWKYLAKDAGKAPGEGWTAPDFDDRKWKQGPSPFQAGVTAKQRREMTDWPSGDDLFLRRRVTIDDPSAGPIIFEAKVDDQAEFYVNGVLAAKVTVWTGGRYKPVELREAARAALKPGINVLAVKVTDIGGGRHFDLSIVQREDPAPAK